MPNRRDLLGRAASALVFVPLAACVRADPAELPPGAVRIPLSALPEGRHVGWMRFEEPVDVIRAAGTVVVRSLFCPHFGCRVAWDPGPQRYRCPCHGGEFDQEGRPVAGPPTDPLSRLPSRLERDAVVVFAREMPGDR